MDTTLNNMFPPAIGRGIREIFGEQPVHGVLLGLLPPPAATGPGSADGCFGRMLHPGEAAILAGYRFAKRQSEYLTGRICAKLAIQGFLSLTGDGAISPPLPAIEIIKAASGRPSFCLHTPLSPDGETPKMDISIAHSGNYGIALAAASKCGVDLQQQVPALVKVQEKYCHAGELRLLAASLPDQDTTACLAMLWAAKEAAKKALSYWRMPGFLDLEAVGLKKHRGTCGVLSLSIIHDEALQTIDHVSVLIDLFAGYALAVCLLEKE
jgi:phosphopantetheinyl transferase (holo-ACP synthase)